MDTTNNTSTEHDLDTGVTAVETDPVSENRPPRRRLVAGLILTLLAALGAIPTTMSLGASAASGTNTLQSGETLHAKQSLRSSNGHELVMQADGNLVLYKPGSAGRKAIWASNTAGRTGTYLVMQNDGNAVLYQSMSGGRRAVWATNTAGRTGTYLVMQNDGNLVGYQPVSGGRRAVWATNTAGGSGARSADGCPTAEPLRGLCARSVSQARSDTAAQAIKYAMNQQGRPYCRPQNPCTQGNIKDGNNFGKGPLHGFDCSGLTWRAYREAGVDIAALNSTSQLAQGGVRRSVSRSAAVPGDIIGKNGHVAILLADGKMVEAPKPGANVRVTATRSDLNRAVYIAA